MKEETQVRASDVIEILGREMYGDDFTIRADKKITENYKKAYETLVKGVKKKPKKGLLLIGTVGAGKSACMRILQRMFKDTPRKFKWVNAYALKDLAEECTTAQIKEMYGYALKSDLYIDDIGFTNDVRRYGNTTNVIFEILMERYELYITSGYLTHLSTNLPTSSKDENIPTLEKVLGKRVTDRLKEMTTVIKFTGQSLRGNTHEEV